jgi:hypothetical protein
MVRQVLCPGIQAIYSSLPQLVIDGYLGSSPIPDAFSQAITTPQTIHLPPKPALQADQPRTTLTKPWIKR